MSAEPAADEAIQTAVDDIGVQDVAEATGWAAVLLVVYIALRSFYRNLRLM